jgi:V/A-type H+-transporting ATPase subunit I
MFVTSEMRYVQILLLERDFKRTIDLLGSMGWLELKEHELDNTREGNQAREKYKLHDAELERVERLIGSICDFFSISKTDEKGQLSDLSDIENLFQSLEDQIKEKRERLEFLNLKKSELESGLREIEEFRNLKVTRKDLDRLNFLHFTMGSLGQRDLDHVKVQMKDRMAVLPLQKDLYLLFTSKKGRWTLESELKKVHFKERDFPFEDDVIPGEVFDSVDAELQAITTEIEIIEQYKKDILTKQGSVIVDAIESFNLLQVYQTVYQAIRHSGATSAIEGWIQKQKLPLLTEKLTELLGDTMSIITWKPEERQDIITGGNRVPTIMENRGPLKAFESLVYNYGAPVYGSIDPTLFVAISFMILFGIMFGDMGQGLVIVLGGLALRFLPSLKKHRGMAPLLISVGIMSMVFGYIYGAAFCFEYEQIGHLFRPINRTLFGLDQPYIIHISLHDPTTVLNLFLLTIGFGMIMNMVGIIINVINKFKSGKTGVAIFTRSGIAGFTIFLEVFIMFIMFFFLKIPISEWPRWLWIAAGVSVTMVLINEPATNIIHKHKPIFHGGIGFWLIHLVIESLEILLTVMSNTLSFIRVGAFAFAHTLLSFVVLELAIKIGGSYASPAGIAIIIAGNALILCLEGMIVSIQTIRLEYYEFFSKFFTEQGKTFIPFKIEKSGTSSNA